MSKSIRVKFDEKLTFNNLLEAHNRAKFNKTKKKEVLKYEVDLETNLINLMNQLKNETYKMGKYRIFTIYEPKIRKIACLPYVDRIVHQWYIEEFIKPFMLKRFIKDTYACIDGRGTHAAIQNLQKYLRIMKRNYGKYYVVQLDIKKYFYNIDKDILFKILSRFIKEEKLLNLTSKFVYDENEGIPIGNYTSQYFANIYLNELDHYLKEELRIKYMIRYMDDIIVLVDKKEKGLLILEKVRLFLKEKLNLELNKKSRIYPNKLGVHFCGYKVFETHILVLNKSKVKIKRKIRDWNAGKINNKKMRLSFNSWLAHISHANSYNLQKSVKNYIILLNRKNLEKREQ